MQEPSASAKLKGLYHLLMPFTAGSTIGPLMMMMDELTLTWNIVLRLQEVASPCKAVQIS